MQTPSFSTDPVSREQRFQEVKKKVHEQLIECLNIDLFRSLDRSVIKCELTIAAERLCKSQTELLTSMERGRLVEELIDDVFGLGPLEPLIKDPEISDILVNGPLNVFVEINGVLKKANIRFRDDEHLIGLAQRIATQVGRRIDESCPMVDARLSDGSRVNAVIRPLALDGTLLSIRKFPDTSISSKHLVTNGTIPAGIMNYLTKAVLNKRNILVSGGTGSGKTTLLNCLSEYIRPEERIVTIEDAAELRIRKPHVARMETRPASTDGRGEYSCRMLLKNALRMRPDRIIVGEVRGDEAFEMLQAMYTGHNGSLSTIHGNSAIDALNRLSMLVAIAAPELTIEQTMRQISSAINVVVQIMRLPNGARRVTQVCEVKGSSNSNVELDQIFMINDSEGISKNA